jgi:heptaprenyl diphosphate synthase
MTIEGDLLRVSVHTRRTAVMGLLFALALALSFLESLIPLPLPLPGIKLGLSNVVTMFCVFSLGGRKALTLAIVKAMFVLLVRGLSAGLLSLSGGLLSVALMLLVLALSKGKASYLLVGVTGAVTHNVGQIMAASLILRFPALWYYLPALVISGCVMGFLTAVTARATIPRLPGYL